MEGYFMPETKVVIASHSSISSGERNKIRGEIK